MAQCITVNADGTLTAVADPCTGHVLLSQAEYAALPLSPFALSAEDGAVLSVAIGAVWAVAWAFKALMRALDTDGETSATD